MRFSDETIVAGRRHDAGQRQGRLRAGRGLCHPSRAAQARAARASIRTSACASSAAAPSRPPTTSTWRRRARRLVQAMDARMAELDALVLPTTPIVAPTIAEVADVRRIRPQERAAAAQHQPGQFLRSLRDLAAAAAAEWASAGLMLVGRNGQDRRLFDIAAAVEKLPQRLTESRKLRRLPCGAAPLYHERQRPIPGSEPCLNFATHRPH